MDDCLSRKSELASKITEETVKERMPELADAFWHVYKGASNQRHFFLKKRNRKKRMQYALRITIYTASAILTFVIATSKVVPEYEFLDFVALVIAAILTLATTFVGRFDPVGQYCANMMQHACLSRFQDKLIMAFHFGEITKDMIVDWSDELSSIMKKIVEEEVARIKKNNESDISDSSINN